MRKYFNTTGACDPEQHYMVDLQSRLAAIKRMVDRGQYFVINRARQYGKTTILQALCEYLKDEYYVISLDFQSLSHTDFESEVSFIRNFARILLQVTSRECVILSEIKKSLEMLSMDKIANANLNFLFECLSDWCAKSEKPVVLLIDEVDSASNNQVFLDFLAQLRGYYLHRKRQPTFHSVILAGVHDVRNIRRKIRPDIEHKANSPWNIAAQFRVDMSFHTSEIAAMLAEYEQDCATGMCVEEMAQLIYDYTAGYPFLVSRICQILDEELEDVYDGAPWTREGFYAAIRMLLKEQNPLFESLANKLNDYPELKEMLYTMLFCGKDISYNILHPAISIAVMFGFLKEKDGKAVISNRIFETLLYNFFLSEDELGGVDIYRNAQQDKNQFIKNGTLDMERVLEKFVLHFHDLYGDQPERFVEDDGRRYFLLYLRPIINGTGNYYVEAETRNHERTDVIVDYRGEQFVIELKIWRGNSYNERGEEQLAEYLDYYHLDKGYMLSFNFNKKKEIGVKHVSVGEHLLVEAVV